MIYLIDGAIDPPHFYISADEGRRALFHYTGMAEHPRLPPIDRSRVRDLPPPVNAIQPPAPSADPAPSMALARLVTPIRAPSPAEDPLAGKFDQSVLST